MNRHFFRSGAGIILFSFLTACGQSSPFVAEMSAKAVDNLGCSTLQSKTFDELYKISEFQKEWPTSKELRFHLEERWKDDPRANKIDKKKIEKFFNEYAEILDSIKQRLPADWETLDRETRLGMLAAIEMEDDSTLFKEKMNVAFKNTWNKVEDNQLSLKTFCSTPERLDYFRDQNYPEIYGSRKVFATAYQGCSSLDLAHMDDGAHSVKGLSIVGDHPMGGKKRSITDLQSVYKTHYYVGNQRPDTQCRDLSKTPLIYDFGGKPYATSMDQSTLNFFVNSGSGTSVLGVDCGGYVFSSLMAAGLRMKANVPMKAVHIYNISANMNPASYNYSCFEQPKVKSNFELVPGDIISTPGHIIMIDDVGPDPFGIDSIQRAEDCRDGVINSNHFDFVISQSSPSKGGIGINRILASTYLKEASGYRQGFMSYAIATCKARFGVSASPNTSSFWLLRHRKTPECRQAEINLDGESCLSSCL